MNRHRIIRWFVAPAIAVALLIALCGVALACPTCASGMDQGDEASRTMIGGWFWSIVFMMSMPFAILGSLGGYMYYLVRKARAAKLSSLDGKLSDVPPTAVELAIDAASRRPVFSSKI